jgi:hypothetical protein
MNTDNICSYPHMYFKFVLANTLHCFVITLIFPSASSSQISNLRYSYVVEGQIRIGWGGGGRGGRGNIISKEILLPFRDTT